MAAPPSHQRGDPDLQFRFDPHRQLLVAGVSSIFERIDLGGGFFDRSKKIHGFHNCLFNSLAVVLTSILASLCVTCEPAAVRKIQSAPMTRPAQGRSDSSELPHFTNFLQLFCGFPSNFGRAVSQQPVVKAGRPLMTHIGSPHASRQNT